MELAFGLNVLFTAWYKLYETLERRQDMLTQSAEQLHKNEYVQEELSIQLMESTVSVGRFWRKWLWRIGWVLSFAGASFFYVVNWHFPTSYALAQGWLFFFAYAPVATMSTMVVLSYSCNGLASWQDNRLQQHASTKAQESEGRVEAIKKTADLIGGGPFGDGRRG